MQRIGPRVRQTSKASSLSLLSMNYDNRIAYASANQFPKTLNPRRDRWPYLV
jgi:hypothetical protein